jgi:hypothetical protein
MGATAFNGTMGTWYKAGRLEGCELQPSEHRERPGTDAVAAVCAAREALAIDDHSHSGTLAEVIF